MIKEIRIPPPQVLKKGDSEHVYALLRTDGNECWIIPQTQLDFFREIDETDEIILENAKKINWVDLIFLNPVTVTMPNTNVNPTAVIVDGDDFFDDHEPVGVDLTDNPINMPAGMEGKNIFYNSKIYMTGTDYILGGFTAEEINSVAVVGDTTAVNVPKLKLLAEERLEKAIEKFKEECCKNILKKDPLRGEEKTNQDVLDNLNNLLQTYLGITVDTIDTEEVKDTIINDSSYQTWLTRIENRIADFKRSFMYLPETINYTGPLTDGKTAIDIESAEEHTKLASLEQMMEALLGINEKNEA